MKTIKLLLVFSVLLLVIQSSIATINAVDREEGGYVGGKGQGDDVCVYNFLKHFSYEQYYWGYKHQSKLLRYNKEGYMPSCSRLNYQK